MAGRAQVPDSLKALIRSRGGKPMWERYRVRWHELADSPRHGGMGMDSRIATATAAAEVLGERVYAEWAESQGVMGESVPSKADKVVVPGCPGHRVAKSEGGAVRVSSRRDSGEAAEYARLRVAAKGRIAGELEMVRWVADNRLMPLEAIDVADIPCPAAVGLLEWARSPYGMSQFYGSVFVKLLPSKAVQEAESRYSDDGRKQFAVIDRLNGCVEPDGFLLARSQAEAGEPVVSASSA